MKEIMARFEENVARIEKMVWLASGAAHAIELLEDFLEDENSVKECFPDIYDHLIEAVDSRDYGEAELLIKEAGKLGFLLEFATPVMSRIPGWSWNRYHSSWVYGDTLEEALEKGFAWVAARRSEDKSRKPDFIDRRLRRNS